MAKTISLTDESYARLQAERRHDETISDVVCRLTGSAPLEAYYGALDDEFAAELEAIVSSSQGNGPS
ncbi:hypothetical protein D8Y22_01535 [Salinadaptatus halalkaliphilus]|uniref:Antitoxin n=1 Tax=Salinadaptatus halalkaliphilus TaxID=2419781 RepID=A0A4S3TQY7_9EURY|nr:antitoxin VapB family protein [Salinadaptatus halalkaliphilus]THE66829.1 hypothetical protein D8Y22_01535 [Salinadaptatus halalkaliphilus]